ncbi:alpha/beta fold hydrolase [Novosphingobium resinovorum]|uniref:alpha/beta fold hydrolase n=1 Tax=Novosphingobium resinovorum TaxID=158500 RepID=UPI003D27A976
MPPSAALPSGPRGNAASRKFCAAALACWSIRRPIRRSAMRWWRWPCASGSRAFERQQGAIIARADPLPGLGAIAVPTLVLVGEDDRTTPPHYSRTIAQAVPGATLVTIPECGHMAPMERPEAVNAALREWLSA